MPHQCTHCSRIFSDAAEELLKGCSCGSRFFYYIRQEKLDSLQKEREMKEKMIQLDKADKVQVEKDIREITGLDEKPEEPVILDLESVKVIEPGKFEIDLVNLFSKRRPLIYKLEEGKYIIDLASSFKVDSEEVRKKIKDPGLIKDNSIDLGEVDRGKVEKEGEEAIEEEDKGGVEW